MNPEREEFKDVRRLLALKRYEQPPPGYFRDFSDRVLRQVEREAQSRSQSGWLHRFWAALETRPALAGVFGVAFCGLMVAGMVFSSRESAPSGIELVGQPVFQHTQPVPAVEAGMMPRPIFTAHQSNQPALPSLFNGIRVPTMPASTGGL